LARFKCASGFLAQFHHLRISGDGVGGVSLFQITLADRSQVSEAVTLAREWKMKIAADEIRTIIKKPKTFCSVFASLIWSRTKDVTDF